MNRPLYVLTCCLVLILGWSLTVQGEPVALTFGVYTSDKPTTMYRTFIPILTYIEDALDQQGFDVHLHMRVYPSYTAAIEDVAAGNCDIARFGPASYVMTKAANPNIRLLVMEHNQNSKRFKGIFVVSKNSPIQSIRELRGKTFAFGNPDSTIGRYLAQAELLKAGISAQTLKAYTYLGRHDKVAASVALGQYDVGVVKENTYHKYAKSKGLKAIGTFLNVTKPWVVRADFDQSLFDALQQVLLTLTDPAILKGLKQDGFTITQDADYNLVRDGMRLAQQFEAP
ncbi:MAG: phosphate/phosphite/phosphonate ABC transporter substrate-binding protein [Candidatus Tectomicrobia bacterium]|nr:phosphate/phosphite/phosphonate ABC transporter substrate-binding protein [Candidatus Tectomicrobia bacterium]